MSRFWGLLWRVLRCPFVAASESGLGARFVWLLSDGLCRRCLHRLAASHTTIKDGVSRWFRSAISALLPTHKKKNCRTEMRTLHLGRLLHAELCTSYGKPLLNVRETQAHCRSLPRPTSTCVSTNSSYASLLTSGGRSTPAKTSSKCGICKNAPESSISPKPSTDAVIPFIAATDNNCQKRRVYKSLVDF